MWLKWLGSGLILFVSVTIGNKRAQDLKKREQQLMSFSLLCSRIETEIAYGQTPLPQIFLASGKQLSFPISDICSATGEQLLLQKGETLDVIWERIMESYAEKLMLLPEDMQVVKNIGTDLGLSYCEEQIKKLQLIRLRLRQQEELAHMERLKMEKVWHVLGWSVGSMLILLFL